MKIFKDDKQEQSYLYTGFGSNLRLIAKRVFISLSDDASDNAPMCDIYGDIDDDKFFVYAITISGTRINITTLFSSDQLENIGNLMSQRPYTFGEF